MKKTTATITLCLVAWLLAPASVTFAGDRTDSAVELEGIVAAEPDDELFVYTLFDVMRLVLRETAGRVDDLWPGPGNPDIIDIDDNDEVDECSQDGILPWCPES